MMRRPVIALVVDRKIGSESFSFTEKKTQFVGLSNGSQRKPGTAQGDFLAAGVNSRE